MKTPARAISAVFCLTFLGAVVALQGAPSGQQSNGQSTPAQSGGGQQGTAQQNADQQQPTVIRRGINYVSVDVIVTDKDGKPVLDLPQDDFSLSEDGKPQTIDNFSVVKLDQVETAMA